MKHTPTCVAGSMHPTIQQRSRAAPPVEGLLEGVSARQVTLARLLPLPCGTHPSTQTLHSTSVYAQVLPPSVHGGTSSVPTEAGVAVAH